jgi:pyruvate/2-oxoglutarate dehydrogenase complex dihydrolipoamide acyltransferase (E2) component
MNDTILLVDYQNVRDSGLKDLPPHRRLVLFVGKGQKPKADFVQDAMRRGSRVDLVPIAEDGNNNLDFHLAFYFGKLLVEEPYGEFIVISNDQDFDPLVRHVESLGIACERRGTTRAAPARAQRAVAAKPAQVLKPAAAPAARRPAAPKAATKPAPRTPTPAPKAIPVAAKRDDLYAEALAFLKRAGKRRPTTGKKLINSLESHLKIKPPRGEQIVKELSLDGVLSIANGAVSYKI